jgi:RNA polymerase sigma-70 factor (ECF subfamily)
MGEPTSAPCFPTTHWSRVAVAGDPDAPEAQAALEGLCRDYWYPLYAFVRRRGLGVDDAADVVQGFLADLIARRNLAAADANRGRFRSFLLAACAHYLANQRDHDRAAKRGGGRAPVPIDRIEAEGRYGFEPFHELTPERLFARRWALDLLERALGRLEAEAAGAGQSALFARLRPALTAGEASGPYAAVAGDLGMTEGAVKMAALRLRRRYRDLLRAEIARTVADPADVDDEVRDLFAAITG